MPPFMQIEPVIVVGGINCDITAAVDGEVMPETSTPGRVSLSPGGVARNVAHGLAQLGVPVRLIGCVGTDPLSEWVLSRTADAGVDVSTVDRVPGTGSGVYVSLLAAGELHSAVSDMGGIDSLDPERLVALLDTAGQAGAGGGEPKPAALVLDLNVSAPAAAAAVRWANTAGVPVVVEPVSVAKAVRLAGVAGQVEVVTPNLAEARALRVLPTGPSIARWVVTRGRFGAGYWENGTSAAQLVSAAPVATVNANGAGDAFLAGLVAGRVRGLPWPEAVRWGVAAGRITAGSPQSVAPGLSADAILRDVTRSDDRSDNQGAGR